MLKTEWSGVPGLKRAVGSVSKGIVNHAGGGCDPSFKVWTPGHACPVEKDRPDYKKRIVGANPV